MMPGDILDLRSSILRERLLNRTFKTHAEFLRQENQVHYDPIKEKTWHSQFHVNDLDIEPTVRLKEPLIKEQPQSVKEYIKKNDVNTQEIQKALNAAEKCDDKSAYFSPALLGKVLEKSDNFCID